MVIQYCALGIGPCLSEGDWVAVWSGLIGAAAAFGLSVAYQAWRQRIDTRQARRNLAAILLELRSQFRRPREILDIEGASFAVTAARAALGWSMAHPELFSFSEWKDLHELNEIIDLWFEENGRLGGFREAVYQGQGSPKHLMSLGRKMNDFLDLNL